MYLLKNIVLSVDVMLQAKVNNSSQIGLGYSQKLRDGELCFFLLLRANEIFFFFFFFLK